jgi:hypothetical protein
MKLTRRGLFGTLLAAGTAAAKRSPAQTPDAPPVISEPDYASRPVLDVTTCSPVFRSCDFTTCSPVFTNDPLLYQPFTPRNHGPKA